MPIDMAEYMRNRRHERYALALKRAGGKCVVCGTTDDLEFDHVDPATKIACVSSATMLDGPLERLFTEVDKCQLLCHDHHVEKTRRAGESGGGHNRIDNPPCGTAAKYGRPHRCRCEVCRRWKRLYRNGIVDTRGAPKEGLEPSASALTGPSPYR